MNREEIPQSPRAKPRFFYGYVIVIVSFFIMLVTFGGQSAFGVFFKPVLTDFGWNRTLTSGAFSLSMFVSGLSAVVMGRFTDRLGPRLIMTICGLLIGLGYLMMPRISAVWHLYLFYGVILGIGYGGVFVTLISTVARWFIKRRSMITGIVLVGTGIGTLSTPPLATRLIYAYNWQISFAVLGIVTLVIVVLACQFLRRDPSEKGQLAYGENDRRQQESKSWAADFSFRDALVTRQLWQVVFMYICFGFTMFAIMVHIVPHATDLGVPATNAANIMIVIGALDVTGRLTMGSVADRIGSRSAFVIGFVLMSLALFWLAMAKEAWMLYPFAVVFGLAYSTMGLSTVPLVARLFGLRSLSSISGVGTLGFQIGSTIGPLLTGYIFDVTGGYEMAFLTCAGVSLVGLILTVLLKPIQGNSAGVTIPVRL